MYSEVGEAFGGQVAELFRGVQAGYERHLLKPLSIKEVIAALEEVLVLPQGS